VVGVGLFLWGCGDSNVQTVPGGTQANKTQTATPPAGTQSTTPPSTGGASSTTGGIAWAAPSDWHDGGQRPMRVATYVIGEGDDESECGVFYFGAGQGGDVDANISRWIGQFQQPDGSNSKDKAKMGTRQVSGLKVTTIDLTGTYMSGGMSGQPTAKPGFRLLGAIVEGPQGPVFFKMTGPDAAVTLKRPQFEQLLGSVKPSGPSM
jgi:hypothetical protein